MDDSDAGALVEEQNPNVAERLNQQERETLTSCEETITTNIHAFVQVGQALRQIRDAKLYRETYQTFERYCRERWDFCRAHCYRLVAAAETMEVLSPKGDILPAMETQVRPLLQFELADRPKVWRDVLARIQPNGSRCVTGQVNEIVQGLIQDSDEEPYRQRRADVKEKKQERLRQAQERHQQRMFDAHGPHETPFSDDELGQLGEIASKLNKAFAGAKKSYNTLVVPDDHAAGHLMLAIEIAVKRLNRWVAGQTEANQAA